MSASRLAPRISGSAIRSSRRASPRSRVISPASKG
jgi:hypothetical protein